MCVGLIPFLKMHQIQHTQAKNRQFLGNLVTDYRNKKIKK